MIWDNMTVTLVTLGYTLPITWCGLTHCDVDPRIPSQWGAKMARCFLVHFQQWYFTIILKNCTWKSSKLSWSKVSWMSKSWICPAVTGRNLIAESHAVLITAIEMGHCHINCVNRGIFMMFTINAILIFLSELHRDLKWSNILKIFHYHFIFSTYSQKDWVKCICVCVFVTCNTFGYILGKILSNTSNRVLFWFLL